MSRALRAIITYMSDDSFEDALRAIADEVAGFLGLDSDAVRRWTDGAGDWLREQMAGPPEPTPAPAPARQAPQDPLRGAGPHPLDRPTDEQGLALAALDSGRWTLEPGTTALSARGEGPGPSDALGLVRELRVRDWLAENGELTLAGRRALARWLEAAER